MRTANEFGGMRTRLGGLVGADLVWRLPEFTPGNGTGSDVVIALVSIAFGVGEFPVLEELSTWILAGYLAVTVAPIAYPNKLGLPADEWPFKCSFAAVTLVVAAGLRLSDGIPILQRIGGLFAIVLLAIGWFRWYFGTLKEWALTPEDPRFIQPLEALFPTSDVESELQKDFARPGLLGLLGAELAKLAFGMVVTVPAVLSGIIIVTLIAAYPLPDILILGWIGLSLLGSLTGRELAPKQRTLDLETRLYGVVNETTKSLKGMTLVVYLLVLTFGFALLFSVPISVLAQTEPLAIRHPLSAPRATWGVLGLLVGIGASSCYGIWCCIRMMARLPTYLRYNVATAVPDQPHMKPDRSSQRVQIARPVGFVIPPFAGAVVLALVVAVFGLTSVEFAVAGPVVLLTLLGCLIWTSRRGSNVVVHDDHYIVVGTSAVAMVVQLLGNLDAVATVLQTGQISLDGLPYSVYIAILVVWAGYIGDVFRYADRYSDVRRFSQSGYFLLFAVVFGGLTTLAIGSVAPVLYTTALITGLAGILFFAVAWFRL